MNTPCTTQTAPAPEPAALANSPTQTPTIEPTNHTPAADDAPKKPLNTSPIDGVLGVVDTLSDAERAELQDNEAVIRHGSLTFFEVGLALANIRDKQLFREDFDSFEAYYQSKWEMQHAKVYYLIASKPKSLARNPDSEGRSPAPAGPGVCRPLISIGACPGGRPSPQRTRRARRF